MPVGTYLKLSNREDMQVSKTVLWDGQVHYSDTVTLRSHFYDNTRVMFNTSVDLTAADILSKFQIIIEETLGEDRKSVRFRMSDFKDGNTDYSSEAVFYSSFYLDQETGFYTLPIYIAARCANGNKKIGFNDCVVTVESDELDIYVSYHSSLPPFIEQGIPYKKNPSEEDPVFPSNASRVDIGVGYIPDYENNSQSYPNDYFFSNSEPLYEVEASGFMPSNLSDVHFEDVEAKLVNSITGMEIPISCIEKSGDASWKTIEILSSSTNGSFTDKLRVNYWLEDIISDSDRSLKKTIKNKLVISAKIFEGEKDPEAILTENSIPIETEGGYILLI